MSTLKSTPRPGIELEQALRALVEGGTVLCYGRRRFSCARWRDLRLVELVDDKEQEVDLDDVYEARGFDGQREIRWRRPLGGKPGAVELTCETGGPDETHEVRYVLWGTVVHGAAPAGWLRLSTPRIGSFGVPWPGDKRPPTAARMELVAEELWRADGPNTVVVDEILRRLRPAEAT